MDATNELMKRRGRIAADWVDADSEPTGWWRCLRADQFDAASMREMKTAIAKVAMPEALRWPQAAVGDAASAIAVVLERPADAAFDAAMTALLVCALEGNAAACVVLSHILRQLPHSKSTDARVATSWLLFAFGKLPLAGRTRVSK